ncbi:hypothetical protein BYT27DRAFT_7334085 [Phlegmacium glaucopus]|nr:hypothetical protein BYT27DRAFT_7334085 [Phlegmacium glaucopus]
MSDRRRSSTSTHRWQVVQVAQEKAEEDALGGPKAHVITRLSPENKKVTKPAPHGSPLNCVKVNDSDFSPPVTNASNRFASPVYPPVPPLTVLKENQTPINPSQQSLMTTRLVTPGSKVALIAVAVGLASADLTYQEPYEYWRCSDGEMKDDVIDTTKELLQGLWRPTIMVINSRVWHAPTSVLQLNAMAKDIFYEVLVCTISFL